MTDEFHRTNKIVTTDNANDCIRIVMSEMMNLTAIVGGPTDNVSATENDALFETCLIALAELRFLCHDMNDFLFNRTLPRFGFTLGDCGSALGFFAPDRLNFFDGDSLGLVTVNPEQQASLDPLEPLSTVASLLAAVWTDHHFQTSRLDNLTATDALSQTWSDIMQFIGLEPIGTTPFGDSPISHRIIKDGKFETTYLEWVELGYRFEWSNDQFYPGFGLQFVPEGDEPLGIKITELSVYEASDHDLNSEEVYHAD